MKYIIDNNGIEKTRDCKNITLQIDGKNFCFENTKCYNCEGKGHIDWFLNLRRTCQRCKGKGVITCIHQPMFFRGEIVSLKELLCGDNYELNKRRGVND